MGRSVRTSYIKNREKSKNRSGTSTVGWALLCFSSFLVSGLFLLHLYVKQGFIIDYSIIHGNLRNSSSTSSASTSQKLSAKITTPALRQEPGQVQSSTPTSTAPPMSPEEIQERLKELPFHTFLKSEVESIPPTLEDVLVFLHNRKDCRDKPIFTTMANVGSLLYWQLIENFIYTMVKYDLIECTLMICVADEHCMDLCKDSFFPCFNHQHKSLDGSGPKLTHTMEQIAQLKMHTIPRALKAGVDIFMLDLDVGFLGDPMILVHKFYHSTEYLDAYVQEDVVFVMNRSEAGWKQWWTEKMPNIGLFIVRGNDRSTAVFEQAWNDYKAHTPKAIRMNPGKDQNKLVQAMRTGRWRNGFKWGYASNNTAVLIDKVFKFQDMAVELGGEASDEILGQRGAVAVHTTCYEQKVKIMGLKAANAFWNPKYYDPLRRTITKKIIFTTPRTVLQEVRALIYLALRTNRTVIIPNLLAATITDLSLLQAEDKRSNKVQRPVYRNQTLWPGFRVLFLKPKGKGKNGEPVVQVEIAEPSFYWRVKRDYASASRPVPRPHIISAPETVTMKGLEKLLSQPENAAAPRVVLHVYSSFKTKATVKQDEESLLTYQVQWAQDSVGRFLSFEQEALIDRKLPEVDMAEFDPESELIQRNLAHDIVQNSRLCANILQRMKGNRSCFDKCD